ncbi:MAG: LptF/LptG family permease [Bacteroidales bacterium]|nr:LptF/LptG family permease [Bacteroidales bacterium]
MGSKGTDSYRIVDRYILLKYLKTFLLALLLITVIIITFDVSEHLDNFLSNHVPLQTVVVQYYANFIPSLVNLYSPLFIFISVLFFTSKMAGNTEIIAILGSGISYNRMLRPYLHGSFIVALAVLLIGNFLIPYNNKQLNLFKENYLHTHKTAYYTNLHFQSAPGVHVYADSYDTGRNSANRFQRDTYNAAGNLVERESADMIILDTVTGQWFCNGYYHRIVAPDGTEKLSTLPYHTAVDLGLTPDDFNESNRRIETMGTVKLIRHIQRERMRGTGNVKIAQVELYQRLLTPLAIIIMTVIGVSISSRKVRGGIGLHLAIGITISFAFVVFMKVSIVFATNGQLPAFLAVLLPQLIFGVASVFLLRSAPK